MRRLHGPGPTGCRGSTSDRSRPAGVRPRRSEIGHDPLHDPRRPVAPVKPRVGETRRPVILFEIRRDDDALAHGIALCADSTRSLKVSTSGVSSSNNRRPIGQSRRKARVSSPAPTSTACVQPSRVASAPNSSKQRVRTTTASSKAALECGQLGIVLGVRTLFEDRWGRRHERGGVGSLNSPSARAVSRARIIAAPTAVSPTLRAIELLPHPHTLPNAAGVFGRLAASAGRGRARAACRA